MEWPELPEEVAPSRRIISIKPAVGTPIGGLVGIGQHGPVLPGLLAVIHFQIGEADFTVFHWGTVRD
jgi:hypothetical protein